MTTTDPEAPVAAIVRAIRERQRFIVTSHARPDGDAIGSSVSMALALRALGKQVRVISRDPVPPQMLVFPGVGEIDIVDRVSDAADAVIVMECGDLERTGIAGLERGYVINIDHHPDNTMYGALNWFDLSAAACGEMVFELINALGVRLTQDIATHVYVAILTDTGSFHYSNITPDTFDVCRRCLEAGVNPGAVARSIFDSNNLGRLKLFGAVLHQMQLDPGGHVATLHVDEQLAHACGGTYEDTEGLVNLPLTVKDIVAVAFFKEVGPGAWRVSLRSKGAIDVNAIAREFGGGGHPNASGCSAQGALADIRGIFQQKLSDAVDDRVGAGG